MNMLQNHLFVVNAQMDQRRRMLWSGLWYFLWKYFVPVLVLWNVLFFTGWAAARWGLG